MYPDPTTFGFCAVQKLFDVFIQYIRGLSTVNEGKNWLT